MGNEEQSLAFPFVRRVGPLAIVGLNSAEETPPFVAAGRLGPDQLEIAGEMLAKLRDEDVIRVVLIHHPPLVGLTSPRRALRDAAHAAHMLEQSGADLVLYGHNHVPALHWLETADGPLPIVGAASASASRAAGHEPLAQYNLFTFFRHGKALRIRHTVRGLDAPGGAVVRLSERILEPAG
jgi:3',5'-cyclic AMP phosphodiesterase CpdA